MEIVKGGEAERRRGGEAVGSVGYWYIFHDCSVLRVNNHGNCLTKGLPSSENTRSLKGKQNIFRDSSIARRKKESHGERGNRTEKVF
jgi:hypothetical protein